MVAGRLVSVLAATAVVAGCGGGDEESKPPVAVYTPPTFAVRITEPASGVRAAGTHVLVSGTTNAAADRVTVNGKAACVADNRFFINDMELTGTTSVSAVASSASGSASAVAAVSVATQAVPRSLRVAGDACGRPIPYAASFVLMPQGFAANAVVAVEADFDGDGVADYKARSLTDRIGYTYKNTGTFRARFTVMLQDGTRLDASRYQIALPAPDLSAELADTVKGISSAFRAQDVGKALTYFTPDAQARRGWALVALKEQLPELANRIANATPLAMNDHQAQYRISVTRGETTIVYDIVMVRDDSGAWKIDSL